MKKIALVLLALFLTVSILVACDGSPQSQAPSYSQSQTDRPNHNGSNNISGESNGNPNSNNSETSDNNKYSEGLVYELSEDGTYYGVKKVGACTDKIIRVPKMYEGKPVEVILYGAFMGCQTIDSIIFPDTIEGIGMNAFVGSSIKEVVITKNITYIGGNAFGNCKSLASIEFEKGSKLSHIDGSFYSTAITSISFENTELLTSISQGSFAGCQNLKTVKFKNDGKLTDICTGAFVGCTSLTSFDIPDSVQNVEYGVFDDNAPFISKENGIYYVDKWAIKADEGLTELTFRSDTVGIASEIATKSDWRGKVLSPTLNIPASVKYISKNAFMNYRTLTQINFASNCEIKSIGNHAFSGCNNLTTVTIPQSVTNVGFGAFSCDNLTTVIFEDKTGWYHENVLWNPSSFDDTAEIARLMVEYSYEFHKQ